MVGIRYTVLGIKIRCRSCNKYYLQKLSFKALVKRRMIVGDSRFSLKYHQLSPTIIHMVKRPKNSVIVDDSSPGSPTVTRMLLISGMGNGERESGNKCTAVTRLRIQNGGQKKRKGSKRNSLSKPYTCQLSLLRRESLAYGLKTSISRQLTLAGQFLTPD